MCKEERNDANRIVNASGGAKLEAKNSWANIFKRIKLNYMIFRGLIFMMLFVKVSNA